MSMKALYCVITLAMLASTGISFHPVFVCLSATRRCLTETAKRRVTQTTPHDSPGTAFFDAGNLGKTKLGHPNRGAKCRWGRLNTGAVLAAENWDFCREALST